jgi:hypothetical protein
MGTDRGRETEGEGEETDGRRHKERRRGGGDRTGQIGRRDTGGEIRWKDTGCIDREIDTEWPRNMTGKRTGRKRGGRKANKRQRKKKEKKQRERHREIIIRGTNMETKWKQRRRNLWRETIRGTYCRGRA